MFKIKVICIGSIKEKYIKDGILEFTKRISRYASLSICELKEEKLYDESESNIKNAIEKEGQLIIREIGSTYPILLDIKGELLSSEQIANKVMKLKDEGKLISFIICGSHGASDELKKIVTDKVSFGNMTFTHQLARLILLEQIYRACNIIEGGKYHK